jgi:hypothetical protein
VFSIRNQSQYFIWIYLQEAFTVSNLDTLGVWYRNVSFHLTIRMAITQLRLEVSIPAKNQVMS